MNKIRIRVREEQAGGESGGGIVFKVHPKDRKKVKTSGEIWGEVWSKILDQEINLPSWVDNPHDYRSWGEDVHLSPPESFIHAEKVVDETFSKYEKVNLKTQETVTGQPSWPIVADVWAPKEY